jgi:hypothetical protein
MQALSYVYEPSARTGSGRVRVVDVPRTPAGGPALPAPPTPPSTEWPSSTSDWQFARLDAAQEVCSGSGQARTCCSATIVDGSGAGYVLAALGGVDRGPPGSTASQWAAQVCGVLACSGSADDHCLHYATQAPPAGGGLLSVAVEMHGASNGTWIFPEVLATNATSAQIMLHPAVSSGAGAFDFDDGWSAGERARAPSLVRANPNPGPQLGQLN